MRKWMPVLLVLTLAVAVASSSLGRTGEIVIGSLQDMSSTTSVWGKAVTDGAELAVEKLNKDGGVLGNKIRLITYDTRNDVQEAINAYNRLTGQDKVVAVIGPPVSNIGIALAPLAEQAKVMILGSFIDERATTNETTGKPWGFNFLMQPSSVQQAWIMASYTLEKLKLKKVGVLYNQANAYSVSLAKPFMDYVNGHGGSIVSVQTYKTGDKDFRTQFAAMRSAGAQTIYLPNYIQDDVLQVQQARAMGMEMPIVGGLDFAPPFASLCGDAANDVYFPNNFSFDEPQLKDVWTAFKARHKEDPLNKVFLGYDSVMLFADAIKRAGQLDPVKMRDAMEKTKNFQGTTGAFGISAKTHRPYGLDMVIMKVEKGQYVTKGRYITPELTKE
ncbi:MAG: ABC transporter substrate-binding protein [Bacteroidota bacterium]